MHSCYLITQPIELGPNFCDTSPQHTENLFILLPQISSSVGGDSFDLSDYIENSHEIGLFRETQTDTIKVRIE